MSCPLFVDYTRTCSQDFPEMIGYSDYDICESDDYENCFHYIVTNSKEKCKYIKKCVNYFHTQVPDFLKKMFDSNELSNAIKEVTIDYCLSEENCKNCKMYEKYELGETSSKHVFPDGKRHITDILLKRKITIK